MSKGFFVVVTRHRTRTFDLDGKAVKLWSALPADAIRGWESTQGKTVEAAAELQKEQYDARAAARQPVPALVTPDCGPMASGKITRFVAVA